MKVTISKSKNQKIYYISKSIRLNGKSTTRTVEKLGTEEEVRKRADGMDPYEWAKQYAAELTRKEKESGEAIRYSPTRLIRTNAIQTINISYLFAQDIYYDLRINELCDSMTEQYSLPFDFNSVFSRLIYTRIIYHASKRGTYQLSKNFLEKPPFPEGDIDKALRFLSVTPLIFQRQLYRKVADSGKVDGRLLFYDCTNYYLETGDRDFLGYRLFGNEPTTPIVQLGLLTDANGLPLSFDTLRDLDAKPPRMTSLEHTIIDELKPKQIIICSDSGLTKIAENKFVYDHDVRYIHVESMKNLDASLRSYAVDVNDWHIAHRKRAYRIDKADENKYFDTVFFKERTLMKNGKLQRMIVTFSMSQQARQRWIRQRQLTRVSDIIDAASDNRFAGQRDYIRRLEQEEQLDGFSVFFTDSDLNPQALIPFIRRRREIEENFRTVKRELRSRSLNLNSREKLYAHFMICFISSLIERIIEMKLHDRYPFEDLSDILRVMDMLDIPSEGYIPVYSRNELTDALHEAFGFRTDNQITSGRTIRKLSANTKKANPLTF